MTTTLTARRGKRIYWGGGARRDIDFADSTLDAAGRQIRGLFTADGAVYLGVQFDRATQKRLGTLPGSYEIEKAFGPPTEDDEAGPWVECTVPENVPTDILARSAEIDRLIAEAKRPAPTHQCAAAADGCRERVKNRGDFCPRCQRDEY